jgi:hypothetical protein
MNCGRPIAPANEPFTASGSLPSRWHITKKAANSARKNSLRSLRPGGKSKLSVASASMTRKLPIMRP